MIVCLTTPSRAAASTNRFQCRDRQLGRLRVRALLNSKGRYAHGHIVVIQRRADRHVERHGYHDHQNQQALEHPQHRWRLGAPRRRVRLLRVESSWFRESIDNFDRQWYDLLIPPHGSRYNRLYIIIVTNLKYPHPSNHPPSLPKDLLTKQDTYHPSPYQPHLAVHLGENVETRKKMPPNYVIRRSPPLASRTDICSFLSRFSQSLFLVAPQILPFAFGDEPASWGELVSVTCSVTKGDQPIEISWTFNGTPIDSRDSDIVVASTNRKNSVLTIESVAARHAGDYTCTASNRVGATTHTAHLAVNGTCNRFSRKK